MFKRILATTALLGVWALPLAAQGHAAKAGTEMTITGSVVDLNCNTTNGAAGAEHQAGGPGRGQARGPLGVPARRRPLYLPARPQPRRPPHSQPPACGP